MRQCGNGNGIPRARRQSKVTLRIPPYRRWHACCLVHVAMRADIDALERRTKSFAIAAIRLCAPLEQVPGIRFVGGQLARSAGSVAANHRAMRRSRSTREFASKLQTVNEEIDESVLWLEIVDEIVPEFRAMLTPLHAEGLELRAIFAKARSTTRQRLA